MAASRRELFVGPPVRRCTYAQGRLALVCEDGPVRTCYVVAEDDGRVLLARECDAQCLVIFDRSLFVLHGPMISMIDLDDEAASPLLVSNFVSGRTCLLVMAANSSFMVSGTLLPRILFSPQNEALPEVRNSFLFFVCLRATLLWSFPLLVCLVCLPSPFSQRFVVQYWIQAHSDVVTVAVASSLGEVLYTGCRDGSIRKWGIGDDAALQLCEFAGHASIVTALLLCCNGTALVSASKDSTLRFWLAEASTLAKESVVVSVSRYRAYCHVVFCFFLLFFLNRIRRLLSKSRF
jgi:hypothetical protein